MPTNNEEWFDSFIEKWIPIHVKDEQFVKEAKISARKEFKQAITQKLQEVERLARVEEINTAIEMTTQVWHNKSLFSNIENINANTLSSTAQYLLTRKAQLTPTSHKGDSK